MSEAEPPNMVLDFLRLFSGRTDEQIKSDFIALDTNTNGQLDFKEFITIVRVAVFNKFTHVSDLIAHLNGYKKEQTTKKGNIKYFRIMLDYVIVDDFTVGTPLENANFMTQFKSAIHFLDTDLNGQVNLGEIIKLVRKIN